MKISFKMLLFIMIILTMCIPVATVSAATAGLTDIKGNAAEQTIQKWYDKGLVQGNPDGTFKPNSSISRAELVALINRAFGYTATGEVKFTDVASKKWFYNDVAKSVQAGYINGYADNTFRPAGNVTRQEVATIVAKILKLDASDSASQFKDAAEIPQWSKGYIGALVDKGIMDGVNGAFNPTTPSTRAETVVVLDKALNELQVTYDVAGLYGLKTGVEVVNKNVVIDAPGVTLQNMEIKGNLTISANVGEGDVFLKGVKVDGVTNVNGGGQHSIHFENSIMLTVIVNKQSGEVRIVANGSTVIQEVTVQTGVRLETDALTSGKVNEVNLSKALPQNSQVSLVGKFDTVNVEAQSIVVGIEKGSISNLNVDGSSQINTDKESAIINLILNAAAQVVGQGKVEKATVNAVGVSLEMKPTSVTVGKNVDKDTQVVIGGTTTTTGQASQPQTPPVTGGGGGETPPVVTPPADTTAPNFTSFTGNVEIGQQVKFKVDENATVYFASAMTLSNIQKTPEFLDIAVREGKALKATAAAGQEVTFETTGFNPGMHNLVAFDAAGNRSQLPPVTLYAASNVELTVTGYPTSGGNTISVVFNKPIVSNYTTDQELKASVTFSVYGNNFQTLGAGDTVSINGNELKVTFAQPYTGNQNKVKVAANSVKDSSGAVYAQEIITPALTGPTTIAVSSTTVIAGDSVEFTANGPTTVYLVQNWAGGSDLDLAAAAVALGTEFQVVSENDIGQVLSISTGGLTAGTYQLVATNGNSVMITIQ